MYVDKQLIGSSPISTSFTYYGTREVEVVADGYRTETILRKIKPPWYQLPGIDFLAESVWPWELRDERVLDIEMIPNQVPVSEELQSRADMMRIQANQGLATPLPEVEQAPVPVLPQPGVVPVTPAPNNPLAPAVTPPPQVLPPSDINWFPERIPEVGGSYRPPMGEARRRGENDSNAR